LGLLGLLEVLPHKLGGVAREKRELLVLGHGVVTGTEELACYLGVVVGLSESARGRFVKGLGVVGDLASRFEKHGGKVALLAA